MVGEGEIFSSLWKDDTRTNHGDASTREAVYGYLKLEQLIGLDVRAFLLQTTSGL